MSETTAQQAGAKQQAAAQQNAAKPAAPAGNAQPAATAATPAKLPPAVPEKTFLVREFVAKSPCFAGRIDPSGKYIFSTCHDFTIHRFEIETGKDTVLTGHDSWIRALGFVGNTFVSGGYDGRLIFWDAYAETPVIKKKLEVAHAGWVRALDVSPDGKLIATCGNDNLIKLWTSEGEPIRQLAGHERHVYNVAFDHTGQHLASADLMGVVKDWEVASGKPVRQLDASKLHKYDKTFHADIGGAFGMEFSADGKYLALGGITNVSNAFAGIGNPAVVLLDWASGKLVQTHLSKANVQGNIWGLVCHPAGYTIGACGGRGSGELYFWKPDAEREFFTLKLPGIARDLSLHPDGLRLAIPCFDGKTRLYQMTEKPPEAKPAAKPATPAKK